MIPQDQLWNISTFCVTVIAPPIIVSIFFFLLRPCQNPQDFVFGKYDLHFAVVGLSLASFVAAPFVLLLPLEILYSGTTWCAGLVGFILAALIVAIFHVPPLHYSRAISLYQYVEDRYHSKTLRYCLLFYQLFTGVIFCVAMVTLTTMYASTIIPKIVDKWIIAACVITLSLLASLSGGQKSAAYLSVLVYCSETIASLFCVSVSGLLNDKIWVSTVNYSAEYLIPVWLPSNVFFDLNLWAIILASFVFFLTFFSATQIAHQHYCSLQTKKRVRISLLITTIGFTLIWLLLSACGLLLWQYYADNLRCLATSDSPLPWQRRQQPATFMELVKSFYINSIFPKLNGFAGYLLGATVAICYAILPSTMTSLSACTWEDVVKLYCKNAKEQRHVTILRLLVVLYAALISVTSFAVVELIDDLWLYLKNILFLLSCVTAPVGAIFLMAVWIPCTNKIGVLLGAILGVCYSVVVTAGHFFYTPLSYDFSSNHGNRLCCLATESPQDFLSQNNDTFDFLSLNNDTTDMGVISSLSVNPFCRDSTLDSNDIFPLFKIPLITQTIFCFLLTFVFGVLFSFLAGGQDIYSVDWNLVYFTCNEWTSKCQCLKFESKKRRRRSRLGLAFATSDSFRYSRQGPFPDNSYHNPKVQTYLDTLTRK